MMARPTLAAVHSGPLCASAPLLALDTATERLAVAAQGPGGVALRNAAGGAQASATLLPTVAEVLGEVGLKPADLAAIAFGRGPGAFTGLRTACSAAQGLAFGAGCPVLPVDSLLIVAEDARAQAALQGAVPDGWTVAVVVDARMDEIYGAVFRWTAGGWTTRCEGALMAPAAVAPWAAWDLQAAAGSALRAFGERLPLPAGIARFEAEQDRAAALLALGRAAAAAGAACDPAEALPVYLRDKVAQTTAEREAARAVVAP